MARLCGTLEPRKIVVSRRLHGYTVQYHLECSSNAGALAGGASATGLAARQVFWRGTLSGFKAHHAHAGFAHGVRKRSLPEHGRVLGTRHGDVHDFGGHLHSSLRILRSAFGETCWSAG